VLADRLAGHVQPGAQFGQGLTVSGIQVVEQSSPTGVGQGLEYLVHRSPSGSQSVA
jgi:hypothetical protein